MGFGRVELPPVASITTAPEFPKRNRRHCFVLQYPGPACVLVEIGGLADRSLARDLSQRLGRVAFWIALSERDNAWGLEVYRSGAVGRTEFYPRWLFEGGVRGPEYEGDATEEAYRVVEEFGVFDPFCTYFQLASDPAVAEADQVAHVGFVRKA